MWLLITLISYVEVKMIGKAIRFIQNPRPYFQVIWYRWWIQPIVWPIQVLVYRYVILSKLVKRCKKKKQLTVLFLAMSVSYWKYDTVYRRMLQDPYFNPIIMPALRTNQSVEEQLRDHDELMCEFKKRGYNIVSGYDKNAKKFVDARSLNPDIVFYTHPYSGPGRLRRQYDFWAMRNSLICYAPYYFPNELDSFFFNHPIQNAAWQLYYAYDQILMVAKRFMDNKAVNVKIAGYALEEEIAEISVNDGNLAWNNDISGRLRVIWAPHHSIAETDTVARTSTFLTYCEDMKKIAVKYKKKLLIAFKPHPVLYSRLLAIWGKKRVDEYYDFWMRQENTLLQTGEYLSLFKGSDAMIHDCGSFKCEYLCLNKPCMFLYRKDFLKDVNEVGRSALLAHYEGHSLLDVISFIENVVIANNDTKVQERLHFRETYFKSPNGRMFSENVLSAIMSEISS